VAFRGSIEDKDRDDTILYSYDGLEMPATAGLVPTYTRHYVGTPLQRVRATGFDDRGYLTYEVGNGFAPYYQTTPPLWDLISYHSWILDNYPFYTGAIYPGGGWAMGYSDVVIGSFRIGNFTHIDVAYNYEMRWAGGGEDISSFYHVHHLFDVKFKPSFGTNNPFDWNDLQGNVFEITDSSSVIPYDYHYRYYPSGYDVHLDPAGVAMVDEPLHWQGFVTGYPDSLGIFTLPAQGDSRGRSNFELFKSSGSNEPWRVQSKVKDALLLRMDDIRPTSFYSASDGLEKQIGIIKANHVENLTQLAGLVELLPDLVALPRLLAKVTKGDPSIVTEVIDYISDAILAYRFAQKPTADDALELAKTDLQKELKDLLEPSYYTLYGKFSYLFTEEENFIGPGNLVLVTRSKVRVRLDFSNLMGTIMTLNGVGLLPTLERVWATVPFSFVVDWFTNMSERLGQVDNQALWMCITTDWCLHSFELTYYPTQEELLVYDLQSPNPLEPFGIKAYVREFSRMMPSLHESRYDFLAPKHGPDMSTVGALTWQLISS
jgi:hypothetical protein